MHLHTHIFCPVYGKKRERFCAVCKRAVGRILKHHHAVIAGKAYNLFIEGNRCLRTGRVVRIVDIKDLHPLPVLVRYQVEIGQEPVFLFEGQIKNVAAKIFCMRGADRIARRCLREQVTFVDESERKHRKRRF